MDTSFFIDPKHEEKAILVVDASGSTLERWGDVEAIFDKFRMIAENLPHEEYRIVFWNSNRSEADYKDGIMKFPMPIKKSSLGQPFKVAKMKITQYCLTMPNLGLAKIHDWLEAGYSHTVHFMTDGQIGWGAISYSDRSRLRNDLANEIKQIFNRHRDAQLFIHAVESKMGNYSQAEGMSSAAGNDVYSVISENQLTGLVSKFTSYVLNYPDGYNHINKIKTPKGFVPYADKYFSEIDTGKFLQYIYSQIQDNRDNEDELLKIVQYLSTTIATLIADKPSNIKKNTIKMFCDMFTPTCIDSVMINFLLTGSIESESRGSASLFAEYRSNLKNLYANANRLLQDDAASALGITDQVMSLPLPTSSGDEVIIVSDHHTPDTTILGFKNGGFNLDGKPIPVIPAIPRLTGTISEQCLRQWIRALLGKQYSINVTADELIYIAMTINLRVQFSFPTEMEIKRGYQTLVMAMLRKKRLNTDTTELARLEEGHLPIPNNGKIESFHKFMANVIGRLGLPVDWPPMRMWYYLCLAYSDKLADAQYAHCKQYLDGEKPKIEDLALTPLKLWKLPTSYEFVCLITMESTIQSGGYRFLPHQNMMGVTCQPRQVLSKDGFKGLMDNLETARCPICYHQLSEADFTWIDPPAKSPENFPFSELQTETFLQPTGQPRSGHNKTSNTSVGPSQATGVSGRFYVLRGDVGSGKTTYANKLKELAEAKGYHVTLEGMDKYTITGMSPGEAASNVSQSLKAAQDLDNSKKIVILDVCNENFQKHDVFGCNFSKWTICNVWVNYQPRDSNLDDYCAWSLRNVLQRKPGEAVLTPDKAGLRTCIDVHERKGRKLFGKKQYSSPVSGALSVDQAIQQLNERADRYAKYLQDKSDMFEPKL